MLSSKQRFNHWFHHRPSLYRPFSIHLLHSIPHDKPKVLLSEDRESDGFLPWLEKKAGIEVSSVLSIGKSPNSGRALFASRFIQSGDCILKVPYSVQISPDNIVPEVKPLLGNDVGNIAKLAIVILAEQRKGQVLFEILNGPLTLVLFPTLERFIARYIPFADFLNHDGTSASVVLSDDSKHISEVIADQNYAPGEEVFIRYGKFPNSTLLIDFGFTLPYNIHDQVWIQMDIADHDNLRTMKLEILHKHHFPAIKEACFNSTGGSFLIRELRSTKGNGKGIPQSLRAFARILSCSSPEELNDLVKEAADTDGRLARHPLMNTSREIQAHLILLSKIDELIEEYKASIKSLRLLKRDQSYNKCSLRRQMAFDLLTGEVRVLRSASEWLKNYCITHKRNNLETL